MGDLLLVLSTFSTAEEARTVCRALVEEGLAACANLLPGVESIYRWEGAVETAAEVLVLLKTTRWAFPALEARLRALHSYEVPEVLAFAPETGSAAYLAWALTQVA